MMWKLVKDNYRNYQKTIRGWLFDGHSEKYSYKVWIDKDNNILIFPEYNSKCLKVEKNEETYCEIPMHEIIVNEEVVKALKLLIEKHIETDFNHRKTKKRILEYVK